MALAFSCRRALCTSLVTLAAGTSLFACAGGAATESVGGGGSGFQKDSGADGADVSVTDGSGGSDSGDKDSGNADTGSDVTSPGNQCGKCDTDTQCGAGFRCIASAFGDKFCAQLCDTSCSSSGYECVDLAEYPVKPASDGGTSDGSTPATDSSTADASVDASDDASDDAQDASSPAVDAGPVVKACVPTSGDSCACNASREGVARTCYKTNNWGTCPGTETCKSGSWVGCDAKAAAKEICDDKDNNCNGFVDMDEPGITGNELCAGGGAPPHSGFTCSGGSCELSGCEKGWVKYPAGTPVTDGCNCKIDPGDVLPKNNGTCDTATDLGQIADVGSTPLLVSGTLSSDKDGQEGDWYAILAKDTKQAPNSNSFRIHVEFLAPDGNPDNEFLVDIIQGSAATPCTPQTTAKNAIAQWDWCTDSLTDPAKPADDDQSAPIRIRVFRNPAATTVATCKTYTLRITNGGSGACPAKDTCGAV